MAVTIQSISVHTNISLLVNLVRPKTLRPALYHCPILIIATRLLEIESDELGNGENQILSSSFSFFLQHAQRLYAISALHQRTALKFSW